MSNDLWIEGPDDIANAPASKRRRRRGSTAEKEIIKTWARIPHDKGLRLAKQIGNPVLAVLLVLEHVVHGAHSNRVKLTNGLLERYGITPQSKTRGLRQLAAAGVISIRKYGKGEAPVVTHYWYTQRGEFRKL